MSDYDRDFDVKSYMKLSYGDPHVSSVNFKKELRDFVLENVHEFYAERATLRSNSARILEFGGGPIIVYLISAVPYASSIVFSDYSSASREAIGKWINDSPDAHDWHPYFDYVIKTFENDESAETPLNRAKEMKSKISSIIHCDVAMENPIGKGCEKSFDVISVSFCFESACKSVEDVKVTLKKLATLLRPGGWIRINGVLGGSYYMVNNKRFFNVTQTEDSVRNALAKAGFASIDVTTHVGDRPQASNADYIGMYHASAQLTDKV
ncbi:phenylethanolamine N-methyltransferase-like [Oscarella lobularis]|uniref:phenylethanolamine N-methyltransferase-like n=1 Tax=Oscarella lobularis TaxID=121494 RepID=UPI00331316F3